MARVRVTRVATALMGSEVPTLAANEAKLGMPRIYAEGSE